MSAKRIKCPQISAVHQVYADAATAPEVNVPSAQGVHAGDAVLLYDAAGNEVRATVRRVELVVVPDFDTFTNPRVKREQGGLW